MEFSNQNTSEWLKLSIAVVALIQPWLIWIYKRFFQRTKIKVYQTGRIEIGFGMLGPSICIAGSLYAANRTFVTQNMKLRLTRERDNAMIDMSWIFFRDEKIDVNSGTSSSITAASAFPVEHGTAKFFNVMFRNNQIANTFENYLNKIQGARNEYDALVIQGKEDGDKLVDFLFRNVNQNLTRPIDEELFWKPSRYNIDLIITTAGSKRPIMEHWTFEINEQESNTLRDNNIRIVLSACGLVQTFSFLYKEYSRRALKSDKANRFDN
ncbi:MAG TPA: hypothetical protein VEH84_14600 [Alphaproteobacteria bacterium]|nr:hypothetical protein [Alphaproteobacteria bacterium]